jgi:hypothetical protein
MSERKRKSLYWLFKFLGVAVSCAFPIWAICEKYPIWKIDYGTSHSIGAGGILIFVVLLVIFRKTIFDFFRDRLKLRHAPPLAVWIVMLITSYVLMYISKFLYDMTTIFWMGFIGCAIGTLLTFIAENRYGKVRDTE